MRTIKGPAIFLAQFAGDDAPFNSLDAIAGWAAGLGYKGLQIPSWKTLIDGLIQSGYPWVVPSYDFFNLRVGVEHEDFTVTGYAENLFDSNYYTNAYQKAFAGGLFAEPSFRSYGVRINYKFDKE